MGPLPQPALAVGAPANGGGGASSTCQGLWALGQWLYPHPGAALLPPTQPESGFLGNGFFFLAEEILFK